ncbi:TonB dependent receptor [Planctomycetes bacterium CA13]|uniref:TonB dependent receptor n=1 Tax=Novipirellula herctigrandis TaxID=2527986 RepID=A0A5C5Z9T2_9BACT|nr:TonB dependent receptor [Planctomycetes bacterium CA13]
MYLRSLVSLRTILAFSVIPAVAATLHADEPEFRLLRIAQYYYGDGANEIRLVQAETTPAEITQPADFGVGSTQFTGLQDDDADAGGRLDLSELLEPELPTAAATTLNSPAQVEAIQELTGRVETGAVATAPLDIVPASTFNLVSTPDAAETLVEVANTQTVKARRRSPIGFDPRIRGYYEGQIHTALDGGFQTPVRGDLDATLSKFDQALIANTEVISGPYGLRHGSNFAFINVDTIPTPRYEGGAENHIRLGTNVRANGGQTYNTATVYGGGERAGYYANVGYRKGSDYSAGNGLAIPSSYDAFNLFSAVGFDIDDDTRMETKFSLVNQGETEYAGQFFDVDDLKHYGLTHSIIHNDDRSGMGYRVDAWVSDTSFNGDTDLSGKRRPDFTVLNRVDAALRAAAPPTPPLSAQFNGDVDGTLTTAGFRAGMTQQYNSDSSVGAGFDFRYVEQRISERYDISEFGFADPRFETGLPSAEIFDPGMYAELTEGITDAWRLAIGARIALVATEADANTLTERSNFKDGGTGPVNRDLDVSDTLASFYITNDFDLNRNWRSRIGMGYAERLPNLTDRYSDGLFLAVIQSGFSRVIGNPELSKERNWQADVRLDFDYDNVRGRVSAFHAWILDYVTYSANEISDPTGARLLNAINTDYATLAGFEAYGEADLARGLQCFASLSYLDGRDREIDQPLAGIYPLESRLGLRLVDPSAANSWGMEWGWRIVDNQDRLGTLRAVGTATTPIPLETATPGFGVSYLRGYVRPTDRLSITGGIENLFDRNYYEHLNLRLPADATFGNTIAYSPGITPYVGVEIDY